MSIPAFLNEDCLVNILSRVIEPRDFWSLCSTCGFLYGILKKHNKNMCYLNYRLSNTQSTILSQMLESENKIVCVTLPMSSGKTALALIYCLERVKSLGGSAIFHVTPKVMETAVLEINKLTKRCTLPVPIYIHNPKKNKYDKPCVIVASRACRNLIASLKDVVHTVIYDEAHIGNTAALISRCVNNKISKTILISAAMPKLGNIARVLEEDIKIIGTLSNVGMRFPEVINIILCPSDGNIYSAIPHKIYLDNAAVMLENIETLLDYKNLNTPLTIRGTGLLLKTVDNYKGKTIVLVHCNINTQISWFDFNMTGRSLVYTKTEVRTLFFQSLGLEYVSSLKEIEKSKSKVLVGDMDNFSEGVNLTMFDNLIIVYGYANPERIRQSAGRIVRNNHPNKSVNICYIGNNIANVLHSMVPRDLCDDYLKHLGNTKLTCKNRAKYYRPDMSDEEKVVLSCTTKYSEHSVKWITERNGFSAYTSREILQVLASKY